MNKERSLADLADSATTFDPEIWFDRYIEEIIRASREKSSEHKETER
jgi:hypothetical protein